MDKRKKRVVFVVLFAIIVIVALTAIIVSLLLFPNEEKSIDSVQNVIYEEWQKSIPTESTRFLKELNERSEFQVVDLNKDGACIEASVLVSSPDISDGLIEYQKADNESLTLEEIDAGICKLIDSAEINGTEQKVYVYIDVNGEYHVRFTQDFINAMFGYAFTDSVNSLYEAEELFVGGD